MNTFRYNISFYYQSTIIYFIVFVLYGVIRGFFIEDADVPLMKDPIIYFFGIIVLVSVISLLYNIYKRKYIEINESGISFVTRFSKRSFSINEMIGIRISKERDLKQPLRLARIKLKHRKRPIIIRPNNYENETELINRLRELKDKLTNV